MLMFFPLKAIWIQRNETTGHHAVVWLEGLVPVGSLPHPALTVLQPLVQEVGQGTKLGPCLKGIEDTGGDMEFLRNTSQMHT